MTFEDFMEFYRAKGRMPSWQEIAERLRKTYKITELKVGSGDKQTSLFYLHEKEDPTGRYFQATATGRDGINWTLNRIVKADAERLNFRYRQDAHSQGLIGWFTIRYDFERDYGFDRLVENTALRRNNLEASCVSPDPRTRLSGAICERSGHNYQWVIDTLFEKLDAADFERMATPAGVAETIAVMEGKLGDKGALIQDAILGLTRDEIDLLRATQPPKKKTANPAV